MAVPWHGTAIFILYQFAFLKFLMPFTKALPISGIFPLQR
jgi:hypothetical protein